MSASYENPQVSTQRALFSTIKLTQKHIAGLLDVSERQIIRADEAADCLSLRVSSVKSVDVLTSKKPAGDEIRPRKT
jgi:hypothetical protein